MNKTKSNFGFIPAPKSGLTWRSKGGFTLIELLVVIAIIGVLATLTVTSLSSAKAKARDANRMNDTKVIATALEIYYQDHGNYPPHDATFIEEMSSECASGDHAGPDHEFISPLRLEGYLSKTPVDPINECSGLFHVYRYQTYSCNGITKIMSSSTPQHYNLIWKYEKHPLTCPSYVADYCKGISYSFLPESPSFLMGCYYK